MKRILLLSFLLSSLTTLMAQVPRMVVIEEFTNASCPPCAAQNPAFNALLNVNLDKVIPIKYQTSYPGFDPYNQQNPSDVSARENVYSPNITGVPATVLDGGYRGSPSSITQNSINTASSLESPLSIILSTEWNSDFTSANVSVTLENLGDIEISEGHVLHVLLVERENNWLFNPGSTEEKDFSYVMRKMYPTVEGTPINAIPSGGNVTLEINAAIPNYIYNLNEMVFIAFVQNTTNNVIVNGAIDEVVTLSNDFVDLEITSKQGSHQDESCNAILTPSATYKNVNDFDIVNFTAIAQVGYEEYFKEVEVTLAPEESYIVVFDEISLQGGSNFVEYSSLYDFNKLNNKLDIVESYPAIAQGVSDHIVVDLEDSRIGVDMKDLISVTPQNQPLISVLNAGVFGASNELGGYGQSSNSIRINFWQWQIPNIDPNGSLIVAEEVIVSDMEQVMITFDRAHAQYNAPVSNDRLIGMVSYDCGGTWTEVYNKSGAALATLEPNADFFIPTPEQWATDTIIVDNSAGNENLLFKFDVVSDWGGNLYIDNINIEEFLGTSNNIRPSINADISIAPNPSNGQAQLHILLAEEADLNVSVYNSLGQRVANIGQYNYAIGEYKIDLNLQHLPAGMYQVVLQDGVKISNKKLMITK